MRDHLHAAKTIRTIGVLAGIGLPLLAGWSLGLTDRPSGPLWIGIFIGYLVGALYAEIALVRRGDPTVRRATLSPRRFADYVRPFVLHAQRATGILAAAAVVPIAIVPLRPSSGQAFDRPTALLIAVALATFAVALEVIERWIVSRPQPFDVPDLVAADDVLRSSSIHSVACAGIAVLLLGLSTISFWLAGSDAQVLRSTMWAPGLVSWPLALYTFLPLARTPWRVTRPMATTR